MVHIAPVLTGSHIYGIASQDRMSSFGTKQIFAKIAERSSKL
jgi:hypothetical protein